MPDFFTTGSQARSTQLDSHAAPRHRWAIPSKGVPRLRTFVSFAVMVALTTGSVPVVQAQTPKPQAETKAEKPKKATRNVSGTVRSAGGDTVVVAGRDKGR